MPKVKGQSAPCQEHLKRYIIHSNRVNKPVTTEHYRRKVGMFMDFALEGKSDSYSRKLVIDFCEKMLTDGYSKSYTATANVCIKSFYSWLVNEEIIQENPIRYSPACVQVTPPGIKEVFTPEEYKRLKEATAIGAGQPYWLGACIIAWHTGLRMGDVAQLKWSHLDLGNKVLNIVPQKNQKQNKMIHIPIPNELLDWLMTRRTEIKDQNDESEFVMEDMADGYRNGRLSREFAAVCQKAEVVGKSFHSFRRTFNTRAIEAGVAPAVLSQLTGQHIATVMRYVNIKLDTKRLAVELMNRL